MIAVLVVKLVVSIAKASVYALEVRRLGWRRWRRERPAELALFVTALLTCVLVTLDLVARPDVRTPHDKATPVADAKHLTV